MQVTIHLNFMNIHDPSMKLRADKAVLTSFVNKLNRNENILDEDVALVVDIVSRRIGVAGGQVRLDIDEKILKHLRDRGVSTIVQKRITEVVLPSQNTSGALIASREGQDQPIAEKVSAEIVVSQSVSEYVQELKTKGVTFYSENDSASSYVDLVNVDNSSPCIYDVVILPDGVDFENINSFVEELGYLPVTYKEHLAYTLQNLDMILENKNSWGVIYSTGSAAIFVDKGTSYKTHPMFCTEPNKGDFDYGFGPLFKVQSAGKCLLVKKRQ